MCGVLLSAAALRLLLASLLRAGSEQRGKTGSALGVPNVDQLDTRCLLLLEAGLGDAPLTRTRQSPDFGTLSRLFSFFSLVSLPLLTGLPAFGQSEFTLRAARRHPRERVLGARQIAVTDRCTSFVVAAVSSRAPPCRPG